MAEEHPLSLEARHALAARLDGEITELNKRIAADANSVRLYSSRGDALFFRGRFAAAVSDYEKMIELDPSQETEHWRRGIAYFYAGRYGHAARQFEIYHSFDNVDRENGIWRYLSQVQSKGREEARQGLLEYEKDDRQPFPDVYRMFSGNASPEQVLERIESAKVDEQERQKRLFYADLYIGLNHAVEDRPQAARRHLRRAVANTWPREAGFGPNYMWHVGRVHYERLENADPAR